MEHSNPEREMKFVHRWSARAEKPLRRQAHPDDEDYLENLGTVLQQDLGGWGDLHVLALQEEIARVNDGGYLVEYSHTVLPDDPEDISLPEDLKARNRVILAVGAFVGELLRSRLGGRWAATGPDRTLAHHVLEIVPEGLWCDPMGAATSLLDDKVGDSLARLVETTTEQERRHSLLTAGGFSALI